MALSDSPQKSKYQVGDTVYFLNNAKGVSSSVVKVQSVVMNPFNDNAGVQENLYTLEGFSKLFSEHELFGSMNALIYNIKGDYLNKWNVEQLNLVTIRIATDLSYSDFSNVDFVNIEALNFNEAILNGCKFTNARLMECDFTNCKMQNCILEGDGIAGANFSGADLTGAILDPLYDTISEFKLYVGEGHWAGTIWINGTVLS